MKIKKYNNVGTVLNPMTKSLTGDQQMSSLTTKTT
jgi:hypothetical protein